MRAHGVQDMTVRLGSITLDNPVIPASGTFGYGYEFAELYNINCLGSLSFKGTTREARFGNELPRIAECTGGLINSIGLQNPGVQKVVEEELPRLRALFPKTNHCQYLRVFGGGICGKNSAVFDQEEQVAILEINVSCPDVHHGGMTFGTDPKMAAEVTRAVKKVTTKPVYIKLSPNVTDIVEIARACEDAGADGISLINTMLGMRIDLKSRKPVVANKMGGFSGSAVFPVALRMVYQVYEAVSIPVIGMGGVASARDVLEMMLAGASAVQVGAANLADPFICQKIISSLPEEMERYRINSLEEIIGGAH